MHGRRSHILLDDTTLTPEVKEALDQILSELNTARRVNAMQQKVIGRLDEELRAASTLQRSLRRTPSTVRGAYVRTIYQPADTLSGDICDVTRIDESRVSITLADVTGHGLTSAILAAHVRRSLQGNRDAAPRDGQHCPSQILRRANTELLESPLQDCQFVTAIAAVFDEDTHVLRWARSGAPYPILLRPGLPASLLKSEGPLLGVVPEAHFETAEVQLRPGDTVVLHTDGLEECLPMSPERYCFDLLASQPSGTKAVDALIEGIESQLNVSNPDDVSVVALSLADPSLKPQRSRESRSTTPTCLSDSSMATVPA